MDKTLSLLGIAKKAGLLAIGSEAAAISARQGKAKLIISATDASAGSVRRAKANAETGGVKYIAVPYTKFELGNITGRGSPGVIAILDKGLADAFTKKVGDAPLRVPPTPPNATPQKPPNVGDALARPAPNNPNNEKGE